MEKSEFLSLKIVLASLLMTLSAPVFSQLTGTKTIGSGKDYATLEAAIVALNASGVGAGGVTFNVTAGHTETFTAPTKGTITTVTSSAANPIVFQKSGAGANPLITAATGTSNNVIAVNPLK